MNFFEKRPLGIILCILLGGFSLFSLFDASIQWILTVLSIILILFSLLFIKKFGKLPLVSSIILLISFALSFLYFESYFPIYNRFPNRYHMEGKITSVVYSESFEVLITVKTKTIDSQKATSRLLVSFVPDKEFDFNFETDDYISFIGHINELEKSDFGFDEKDYYEAKGIQGFVKNAEDIRISNNSSFSFLRIVENMRNKLTQYIKSSAEPTTAGLLCALITGDKSELPGPMRLNFQRIGLSHVLAVSGMHLAILTTGLHKLLSMFSLDKKWRCLIAMLFVIFYMGITGFPLSVLRAGGMVLISNLLFLLAQTRDSFTNLMISVTVIVLVSPYAVRDMSLLLSFFATIGVLAALRILEKTPYHISRTKKILIAVFSSLLSSFFAISLTLPFSVFSFERLSTVAPITTLLFSFLIEIFIYFGSIFLLVGAPHLFLAPIEWLAKQIADLSAYFSDLNGTYVAAESILTKLLTIVFYCLLLGFLIFKIKWKKCAFALVLSAFLSVFIVGYFSTQSVLETDRILYLSDTEKNETILLIDDQKTAAIAMIGNSAQDANYFLHLIDNETILKLDYLYIPQYNGYIDKTLSIILSYIPVDTIFLPEPKNSDEALLLSNVTPLIHEYNSHIETVAEGSYKEVSKTRLHSIYRAQKEEGFRVIFSLQHQGEYYSYFSHGAIKDCIDQAEYLMSFSRALIFGSKGPQSNQPYYIDFSTPHTDILVFQSDDILIEETVYLEYNDRVHFHYKKKQIDLLQ